LPSARPDSDQEPAACGLPLIAQPSHLGQGMLRPERIVRLAA